MSALLNSPSEEGTPEDLLAQVERLTAEREETARRHDARVTELLAANNAQVERRRIAEAALSASSFQSRVAPWLIACHGAGIADDLVERGDRLAEEVLELLQATGYPPDRVAALTAYVWGRPVGVPRQEVGGVMVTLAAFCRAQGIDMHIAGEAELVRIWTKIEQIRAKQAAKPTGAALLASRTAAPAQPNALRRSIAELDAWLAGSDTLDEIENQTSFGESIWLVVDELKRLQAVQPPHAEPSGTAAASRRGDAWDHLQMHNDIAILLAQIDWFAECTGEDLEALDAALVCQIQEAHDARDLDLPSGEAK